MEKAVFKCPQLYEMIEYLFLDVCFIINRNLINKFTIKKPEI